MHTFTKLILASACLVMASSSFAQDAAVGFQAWKTTRIDEAKANLDKLQAEKTPAPKKADGRASRTIRPDQKIQQAQSSLEIAKELSLNDYFVLYVSQLKDKQEFLEVAKKLTPDETAELLMAYQRHLSGGPSLDVVIPAGGIGSASLGK